MRYFGEPWGAICNEELEQGPQPIGWICPFCERMTTATDRGLLIPFAASEFEVLEQAYHLDCFLKHTTGFYLGEMRNNAKRIVLLELRTKWDLDILVETGTGVGHFTNLMANDFNEIHTIEIDPESHEQANKLLFPAHRNVMTYLGDSAEWLVGIIADLDRPALFFLDAHYSGGTKVRAAKDTPIREELQLICTDDLNHIIVIDDANGFGDKDWPTYEEVVDIAGLDRQITMHDRWLMVIEPVW